MNKKNAFTTAEALITLTMIGVIAAVTLPIIGNSLPDKDQGLYLKAFHTLESINSDIIKDVTRYDQDIDATQALGFHQKPLQTAQVNFKNVILTKANAYCYFVAEQLNSIGAINCSSGDVLNVKTVNNICYRNLAFSGSSQDSTHDVIVDIGCKNDPEHKYAIRVSALGRTTVPSTSSKVESKMQKKASYWIEHQDVIKTKTK